MFSTFSCAHSYSSLSEIALDSKFSKFNLLKTSCYTVIIKPQNTLFNISGTFHVKTKTVLSSLWLLVLLMIM